MQNQVLMMLCLLQALFGIGVIYPNVVPMDEEFGCFLTWDLWM